MSAWKNIVSRVARTGNHQALIYYTLKRDIWYCFAYSDMISMAGVTNLILVNVYYTGNGLDSSNPLYYLRRET